MKEYTDNIIRLVTVYSKYINISVHVMSSNYESFVHFIFLVKKGNKKFLCF